VVQERIVKAFVGFAGFDGVGNRISKMKCILPYSDCVYLGKGRCRDSLNSPFNGDAKCHRLAGKKAMIKRARLETTRQGGND